MGKPSKSFSSYMLGTGIVGWVVLVWLSVKGPVYLSWEAGFFLALAVLVGLHPVKLPRGATTTVGFAVDYACLLIFGPAVVAWIGVISFGVLLRRSSWLRKLFNQGQVVLSFAGAGWVYRALGGEYVEGSGWVAFREMELALVGGGVAYFCLSSLLIAIAMALWERRSVGGMWVLSFRWAAPRFLALAPFGLLMAMVYQTPGLGVWAVGLFLVPLVGARFAFQGAMETLELHRETVHALSNALEAYDPYTRNHSELVTRYALALGREMELAAPRMEVLEWACRLHDIGKCRQDWESIITKPGRPSEKEWEVIRRHPVEGSRLAEKMEFLPHTAGKVAQIVRAHHERLDGSGYPDSRRGEEIPLEARILGVADAFEAMTARRAYHQSRSAQEAIEELRRCAGEQFDAKVVETLAALWERGEVEPEAALEQQPAAAGALAGSSVLSSYAAQREAGGGGG
ncbi:MAG: HD-GYP domain-containing protein [Armatimonadota bacterium]|nr:MAG: HD-GYP domain-containing protein [Armatimonadota bacterium]